MRVFVVGTGRCGTVTFYHACRHITNFTSAHEGKAGSVPPWEFPDNHIEIGSHLFSQMGPLCLAYPDAIWIHLVRNREDCTASLASQCAVSMEHHSQIWFHAFRAPPQKVAEAYYDMVNTVVPLVFPLAMRIDVESAVEQWPDFLLSIGAEVDVLASQDEWGKRYNATGYRGIDNHAP